MSPGIVYPQVWYFPKFYLALLTSPSGGSLLLQTCNFYRDHCEFMIFVDFLSKSIDIHENDQPL